MNHKSTHVLLKFLTDMFKSILGSQQHREDTSFPKHGWPHTESLPHCQHLPPRGTNWHIITQNSMVYIRLHSWCSEILHQNLFHMSRKIMTLSEWASQEEVAFHSQRKRKHPIYPCLGQSLKSERMAGQERATCFSWLNEL